MKPFRRVPDRWSLGDLVDFEALLAAGQAPASPRDRIRFARDIRAELPSGDARRRRRIGLRRWLDMQRETRALTAGDLWQRSLVMLRLGLFVVLGITGLTLAAGLCAAPGQTVHVVLFVVLTLVLPWTIFAGMLIARRLGGRRHFLEWLLARLARLSDDSSDQAATRQLQACRESLTDSAPARSALGAALGGALQWGAVGFNLGMVLAFAASLMVFDVRFYWEATPRTEAVMTGAARAIALPWGWAWPGALPTSDTIRASRARYDAGQRQVPAQARTGAVWWRFLLMALLVWGLLPRLLLVAWAGWRQRRALARLDFQAPRHRVLWRQLTAVERGTVAPVAADGALVLDVGGIGVSGEDIRGFLLRALRVNPVADHRIGVLDERAEANADAALAEEPSQVVLLVDARDMSPRRIGRQHARVRASVGADTPITWVVLALADDIPAAPEAGLLSRWTRFIDDLRDPAAEIAGYEPGI